MDNSNYKLIIGVLLLPLVGAMVQAFFGKWVIDRMGNAGKRLMGFLAVLPIAIGFGIGAFLTSELAKTESRLQIVYMFDWIKLISINIPFELRVDTLSMTMVLIITGIGSLIHLYATGYMAEEREYSRFFTYLNLFISCMLILVLGNNLVLTFIGWEGVGLCSYLLIGFWYKEIPNAKAANKAFIVNRIGDWGLTLGMFLLASLFAVNYATLHTKDDRFLSYDFIIANAEQILGQHPVLATAIALLLFVGAMGKSAQFPLYLWLPDAMAGPTPVSALIHAATMVTAGVFLMNRMSIVFVHSQVASAIICVIGAFTAFFAACIAFAQNDIKKVLAYSTVSQLGFMFVACGAGFYWAGMFHVVTHAFFKALLFLGSGAVIHAMNHDQDMRHYGGLWKKLPITFAMMAIGWLAISGIPGFAGFYSKEAIISGALGGEHAAIENVEVGQFAGMAALFVAMMTAWYMTRMTAMTFFGKEKWRALEPAHEGAHGHDDHGHGHVEHAHHDHGPDSHGFFYTDAELEARHAAEPHEHHHELDASHEPHEVPPSMWIPLVVLGFLSLVGGWYLAQGERFQQWLYPNAALPVIGEQHPIEGTLFAVAGLQVNLLGLSLLAALGGMLGGIVVWRYGVPRRKSYDVLSNLAANQFFYDKAMVDGAVDGGREIGLGLWKGIDVRIIDGLVNGAGQLVEALGKLFRVAQTGFVRGYALLMLVGGVGILGWLGYAHYIASHLGGGK